ncbi:MAG: flavodoxin family protein [Deltaproteobacteria bacterium]|nr:flavodoxin family protein [Deltaproteobacteria bacterium]
MRLMAIIGSPRRGGNTDVLADKVIEGYLSKTTAEVVKIFVTEKKIGYCTGCLSCTFPPPGTKTCIIRDDMDDLLAQLTSADAFIFGTPNHMRTVSAPLLTFLSRMLPLMQFLPDMDAEGRIIGGGFTSSLKGKKAAMVISQGDPIFSSALVHAVLERNLIDFGIRRVGDVISSGNMLPGDAAKKQHDLEKAFQLGVALYTTAGMY